VLSSPRPEPDTAEPSDFLIIEKADKHGMNAPTVGQKIVTQRIMTNDTFALGIDGGQSNDPPDRARFGQLRTMEIRTSGEHISLLFDEISPATLIKGKA